MRNVEFPPGFADGCCDSMWNGSLNSGVYDKMKGDETACGKIAVVRRNLRCHASTSKLDPFTVNPHFVAQACMHTCRLPSVTSGNTKSDFDVC